MFCSPHRFYVQCFWSIPTRMPFAFIFVDTHDLFHSCWFYLLWTFTWFRWSFYWRSDEYLIPALSKFLMSCFEWSLCCLGFAYEVHWFESYGCGLNYPNSFSTYVNPQVLNFLLKLLDNATILNFSLNESLLYHFHFLLQTPAFLLPVLHFTCQVPTFVVVIVSCQIAFTKCRVSRLSFLSSWR